MLQYWKRGFFLDYTASLKSSVHGEEEERNSEI